METKQLNGYKVEFYSKKGYYNIDNIWDSSMRSCDGSCSTDDLDESLDCACMREYDRSTIKPVYAGLVSEISEELAEKIVDKITEDTYKDYHYDSWAWIYTAKQSFQTLSNLPYVVITKLN